ncbi:hypothetical protein TNCV_2378541 [Trichonephila clavipes]|nr:hypothetical protein TNCV_2378541 [Trichonephila clavipes]
MFSMSGRSADCAGQVQGLYSYIENKQATSGLLEAPSPAYGHQNTVRRTETRLKRRQCATPVSIFIVRGICLPKSREAEVMVAMVTVHAAADVVVPFERVLGVL